MKNITVNEALEKIKSSKGKFFTATFVKRTNLELRTMNCRLGVKKNIKGNDHRKSHPDLLTVYDMSNKGYRTINITGLRSLSIDGKTYNIL